jgi:hypothetical protein
MEAYHTPTPAASGELPGRPLAFDALIDELRRLARELDTTMIRIGHRALAKAIKHSPSLIPSFIERLMRMGLVTRTRYKNSYVLDVAALIDHPDRSPLIDHPPPDREPPRQDAPNSAATCDRVKTGCMVDHESKIQEKKIAQPLFNHLATQPGMSTSLAKRIAQNPLGTLSEFLDDVRRAEQTPGIRSPFFFTVARWRDGQRVDAPQEPQHGHEQHRPDRGTRARRRAEAHQSTTPTDRAAYDAFLAECLAAPLATCDNIGVSLPGYGGLSHGL